MSKITTIAMFCPICRGQLTYETIGSYGDLYRVGKTTGKPAKKRFSRQHYECCDGEMLYCLECGENFEFKWVQGVLFLSYNEEEYRTNETN